MRISLLLPSLFIILSLRVPAQERAVLSPLLGYEFGVPHSIDRDLDVVNRLGASGPGVAFNHSLYAGAALELPGLFAAGLGGAVRFELVGSAGAFRSNPIRSAAALPAGSPALLRELNVEVRSLALSGELRAEFMPAARWSIGTGAWGSYRIASDYVETERSLDPGRSFPGGVASRVIARGDSLGSAPFRYGLLASLRHAIPISSSLAIAPEIYGRIDLPSAGLGLRALSAGAGVALRFGDEEPDTMPAPSGDAPSAAASPDETASSIRPQLAAAIDLRAIEPDGGIRQWADIAVAWERRRITLELPSALPLPSIGDWGAPPDDSIVSERIHALLDALPAGRGALAGALPDAVGIRMRRDSSLRAVLTGAGPGLGVARALLANRWGIAAGRIATVPVAGDAGDIPIELSPAPGDERLFAAIEDEWLVRRFRVPRLDLSPEIISAAGVRRWEVTVRHRGRVVAASSSDGASFVPPLSVEIPGGAADAAIPPFVAELSAEDSAGTMVTARDTLPLRVEEHPAAAHDRARLVWTILLVASRRGAGASGDPVSGGPGEAMIERAAAAIVSGDRIVVAGAGGEEDVMPERVRSVAGRLRARLRGRGVIPGSLDVGIGEEGAAAGDGVVIVITREP